MGKFKIGDRVKRVNFDHYRAIEGCIYGVSGTNGSTAIMLNGHGNYTYSAENFELATPFTINPGDYIDSRAFSREECERFCELAVECGFGRGEWMHFYNHGIPKIGVTSVSGRPFWSSVCRTWFINNITPQFREFLNKEKGMLTKADLKDGMRVETRKGITRWVCSELFLRPYSAGIDFDSYAGDLTYRGNTDEDIMMVVDRDGTVLFEREEHKELTLQEIADKFGVDVKSIRIKE